MLRLAKQLRDIKLSKVKKEKGGLSNESKEVENESSWSCSSSYELSALHFTAWAIDVAGGDLYCTMEGKQTPLYIPEIQCKAGISRNYQW